jgi:hypothetical protein
MTGWHPTGMAGKAWKGQLVPRRGLEPPRCYPLVPETSASTNSATWAVNGNPAGRRNVRMGWGAVN